MEHINNRIISCYQSQQARPFLPEHNGEHNGDGSFCVLYSAHTKLSVIDPTVATKYSPSHGNENEMADVFPDSKVCVPFH
jgi:hypothetical protein